MQAPDPFGDLAIDDVTFSQAQPPEPTRLALGGAAPAAGVMAEVEFASVGFRWSIELSGTAHAASHSTKHSRLHAHRVAGGDLHHRAAGGDAPARAGQGPRRGPGVGL